MTLIDRSTRDRIPSNTDTALTHIRLCTPVAVIAACPIGFWRARTKACIRVANTRNVARIDGSTHHRGPRCTCPIYAGVGGSTRVKIVANGPVGRVRTTTNARGGIASTGQMAPI